MSRTTAGDAARGEGPRRRATRLGGQVAALALLVAWTAAPAILAPQLEPDDYRYLDIVGRLGAAGGGGLLSQLTVVNSWEHLWWTDTGGDVRFFRPTVVLSYALDRAVWGGRVAAGLFATNAPLHLACVLLVLALLRLLRVRELPAFLATLLFAALACHGEVLWYVAGRTDSLAAAAFLAALVLHAHGAGRRRGWSAAALGAFALALLTKELTVVLPLVCLAHDALVAPRGRLAGLVRRRAPLYGGYAAVTLVYLGVRALALPEGTRLVFPYFVDPLSPRFAAHLLTQLQSYAGNLVAARQTPPFLQPADLAAQAPSAALAAALVVAGALAASLAAAAVRARALFACVLALLTWIPTSVVYVSERYLYLPSAALALAVGLALQRWDAVRAARLAAGAAVVAWALHQGVALRREIVEISRSSGRDAERLRRITAPVRERIPRGANVLVLDFPLDWLAAQFLEQTLRAQLGDPTLRARILTHRPQHPDSALALERLGERQLRLSRFEPLVHRLFEGDLFGRVSCTPPARIARPGLGFDVDVVTGAGEACYGIEVTLPLALSRYTLLWYRPPAPAGGLPRPVDQGRFVVLDPPGG